MFLCILIPVVGAGTFLVDVLTIVFQTLMEHFLFAWTNTVYLQYKIF
jgi:hypothetical protein